MCVICVKPKKIDMPGEEEISNMWINNPDGAGFMYTKDGKVYIEKGFMSYNNLQKALEDLRKRVDIKNTPMILHFRITTHGGTKPENCHPFPVTESVGMLQKRKTTTRLGVAHNGIIRNTPRKGISDTMEYIVSQLGPLQAAVPKFYENEKLIEMISNAIDSKMAFLDGNGKIVTIGNFVEEGGIKYSNTSYKSYRWSKSLYDYYDEDEGWHSSYKNYYTQPTQTSWQQTYTYREKALMYLDEAKGEFVTNAKNEYEPGDFAIDSLCNVFKYNDTRNLMEYKSGYTAFNMDGNYLKYDYKSDNIVFEYTYGPSYVKGALTDGKK